MKVVCVGGAPSSQMLAPFDDEGFEIWVLGNQFKDYKGKRVTRIFEIHDDLTNQHPEYARQLVALGIPLVVGERFPLSADHVKVFPFAEARRYFGRDYLTSSAAYMIALALIEGASEVHLYGFDMAVDDAEYFHQRPCMEAWLGMAMGRGVKVGLPSVCPVLKSTYIEGKDGKRELGPFAEHELKARIEAHRKAQAECDAQIDALRLKHAAHGGAADVYERMAGVSRALAAGMDIKSLEHAVKMR